MAYLFPVVILGLMWVLVIAPQQRRTREHARFVDSVAVGDAIVTVGGMYGTVTGIDGDEVGLVIAPGVEITIARRAIAHRQVASDAADDTSTTGTAVGELSDPSE